VEEINEKWMDKIRSLAQPIQKSEYEILKCEAKIKKKLAMLKIIAFENGNKTVASQEVYAENDPSLYKLRLEHAVVKSNLASLKIQLEALKVGFEEWRTKMVNAREEQKRYGA
jgi:hypothetical protein